MVAAVLAVTALAGCASAEGGDGAAGSGSPSASQASVRVAFFNPIAANAYTAATLVGVKDSIEEYGATLTVFDAAGDQNKQVSQMRDAIASGAYDAFVVMPLNGAVLVKPTEEAIAAGIKVVANWNNIGPDLNSIEPQVEGLSAVVGNKLGDVGTLLGQWAVKACEGINPCEVAYIPGTFAQATEKLRLDAAVAEMEKVPGISVKLSADGEYQAGPAQAATTDVLLANPGLDVIVTPADQMMLGVVAALKEADKLGQIKLIGGATTKQGVALVRDGTVLADTVMLPESEGRESTKLAILAARGEEVPRSVNMLDLSPIGPVATLETLSTPAGKDFFGEYEG